MTLAHLPKRNPRHCLIGQTTAGTGPARALGRQCHVKPTNHVSLTARIIHTGTLDIAFGPGSGAFSSQFNDPILRPGEHFDSARRILCADGLKSAEQYELVRKHGGRVMNRHE